MSTSKVTPFPKETIWLTDRTLARCYLIARLSEIQEFETLWERIRQRPVALMEIFRPHLSEYLNGLSPAGRGALATFGTNVFALYDNDARCEAVAAWKFINVPDEVELNGHMVNAEYQAQLEVLVKPLGIPDLSLTMIIVDAQSMGLNRIIFDSGPIEGPFREILETKVMTFLTDLSPSGLARETPGRIRDRMELKSAPLRRHLKRFNLAGRIDLWVMNVVYGVTYEEIAGVLQDDEQYMAAGQGPYEWVRKQVRDANHLFDVTRRGRPRKGGVLRQWKLMAE